MKYIIFSFEGNGFPIAKRLIEEGQDVQVGFVENIESTLTSIEKGSVIEPHEEKEFRLKHYDNMLPKISADLLVKRLKKIKNPQDYFIFFDSNNLFYFADQVRDLGFHGNFPTEDDRLFELDRNKSKEFVMKHYPHLKTSYSKSFKTIAEGIKFVKKDKRIWVVKSPSDNIMTFVPKTNEVALAKKQVIERLETYKEEYEIHGFLLEQRIDDLIEITPEKFYYDGQPLCMTINLENKFIGSGNIGEQVGCAGDVVFPVSMKSKIHDICFPPVVDAIAKQHKGFFIWDASILIDKKTGNMYFGEFCPNRPGYNSFITEITQAKSVHAFFEDIVKKKNPLPTGTIGASLMLFTIARDKNDELIQDAGVEIVETARKYIWPYDVYKKTQKDILRTVGYDKHFSPVTGVGKTVQAAVDHLYENVQNFLVAEVYYRPKFDYLSKEYPTSILNRLDYCLKKKLFALR